MTVLEKEEKLDGFISKIILPDGKTVGLKCYVTAVNEMKCPNCGAPFELAYGKGRCNFCGSQFTTRFKLTEERTK